MLAGLATLGLLGSGQSVPAFDVTAINPSDPQSPVLSGNGFSPHRLTATGTLRDFVRMAYNVQDSQIVTGIN